MQTWEIRWIQNYEVSKLKTLGLIRVHTMENLIVERKTPSIIRSVVRPDNYDEIGRLTKQNAGQSV